jgi:hypothetical protein
VYFPSPSSAPVLLFHGESSRSTMVVGWAAAAAAGDARAVSDSMCIHLFQLQPQSVRYWYVPCGNGEMVGARMHSINFNTRTLTIRTGTVIHIVATD